MVKRVPIIDINTGKVIKNFETFRRKEKERVNRVLQYLSEPEKNKFKDITKNCRLLTREEKEKLYEKHHNLSSPYYPTQRIAELDSIEGILVVLRVGNKGYIVLSTPLPDITLEDLWFEMKA